MHHSSSGDNKWSERILFGANLEVKVGEDKKEKIVFLALSSTNLLFMHEKETQRFLPDWPYTYTSGERERVRTGVWPRSPGGSQGQSFLTSRAMLPEAEETDSCLLPA